MVKLLPKGPKFRVRRAFIKTLRPSFSKGAIVGIRDTTKRTPLAYASIDGHLSMVRMLVKAGARADLDDYIGGTPISYARCIGRQDVVNELAIRDELLLSAL